MLNQKKLRDVLTESGKMYSAEQEEAEGAGDAPEDPEQE